MRHMTGKAVIQKLIHMSPKKPVYLGDSNSPVNDFFSWRGSYDQPSINSSGDETFTGSEIVDKLIDFLDSIQIGWKGGEFAMDEYEVLWCDPEGTYCGNGVSDVVETEDAIYIKYENFRD